MNLNNICIPILVIATCLQVNKVWAEQCLPYWSSYPILLYNFLDSHFKRFLFTALLCPLGSYTFPCGTKRHMNIRSRRESVYSTGSQSGAQEPWGFLRYIQEVHKVKIILITLCFQSHFERTM